MDGTSVLHDVVAFARALRAANVPVGLDQTEAFAQALGWVDPLSRREVYLAARAALVFRREDVPVFDAMFDAFWCGRHEGGGARKAPLAPRHVDLQSVFLFGGQGPVRIGDDVDARGARRGFDEQARIDNGTVDAGALQPLARRGPGLDQGQAHETSSAGSPAAIVPPPVTAT